MIFIGSVSERLVRHSSCPVLTVRLHETDVIVDDADHARRLSHEAINVGGYDVSNVDVERQSSVWVGHDESADGRLVVVKLDLTTEHTTAITQ